MVLRSRGGARWSHRTSVKVLVQAEKLGEQWLGAAAMWLELCSCDGEKLAGGGGVCLGAPIYRSSPTGVGEGCSHDHKWN
jgi:hypothetical protein